MKYHCYKLLQNYVHADYARQKAILTCAYDAHVASLPRDQLASRPVSVLELACGDGKLAVVFPAESYLGVDIAAQRVRAARLEHPDYHFAVCDVMGADVRSIMRDFDFIFCHGLLHHLDDRCCSALLSQVRLSARKPTTFLAIEPVLPVLWQNPLGVLLARLDDGRWIRRPRDYHTFFPGRALKVERLNYLPRWPVNMEVYMVRYE